MDNILKQLREEANLTQETVADNLGVSVNTIQNWERTGKIAKESLHDLMDLYGADQLTRNRVVLAVFGDNQAPSRSGGVDNFPDFLFTGRPDIVSSARRAVLTSDEMELFGYTYYMSNINGSNGEYGHGPRRWPLDYEVFKDYGGYFNTMKLINSIEGRVGEYFNAALNGRTNVGIATEVYNYGLMNPGAAFSFIGLSKNDIINMIVKLPELDRDSVNLCGLYQKCKAVVEPVFLGTDDKSSLRDDDMPEIIRKLIKAANSYYGHKVDYELDLDEICGQCIALDKKESEDADYLQRKEQHLSDRKAYDEHPDLYDRQPSFKYEFEYWLRLTDMGEKYIKWVES